MKILFGLLWLSLLVFGLFFFVLRLPTTQSGGKMTQPNWTPVIEHHTVNAPKASLWVKVADYIRGPRKLKIEASGHWNYDDAKQSEADGEPSEGFSDNNLHKSALRGCLIAKVGGGSGDSPGSEKIFAVGSFAIIDVGDVSGALFLSMNDAPKNFRSHGGSLTVSISEAP
jgi:hypothetical protein